MLRILTVHYKTPKWIDVQLDFIERNISVPRKTYGCIEDIDEAAATRFDAVIPAFGPHAGKLNYLAAIACNEGRDDDLLMFLDGDAFPIADPMPVVLRSLASSDLVAVRRDENLGDRQPHPCFAVTSVGTWKRIHGDWSKGHPWTIAAAGMAVSDVGANLMYLLDSSGSKWTPLLRSNTRNMHPLYFAVYGDIVYHHGAGFRPAVSRLDVAGNPLRSFGSIVGRAWRKRRTRANQALSDQVFERIRRDPHFFRDLCGVGLPAGAAPQRIDSDDPLPVPEQRPR